MDFDAAYHKLEQVALKNGRTVRDEVYRHQRDSAIDKDLHDAIKAFSLDYSFGVAVDPLQSGQSISFPRDARFARLGEDKQSSTVVLKKHEIVEVLTIEPTKKNVWSVRRTFPPYHVTEVESDGLILLGGYLYPNKRPDIAAEKAAQHFCDDTSGKESAFTKAAEACKNDSLIFLIEIGVLIYQV